VAFPTYRLVVVVIAVATALALHLLMDRTRIGAMIRAGVDDMQMARAVGIPCRGFSRPSFAWRRARRAGGIIGGRSCRRIRAGCGYAAPGAYRGHARRSRHLLGAFVGSFLIGAIYTFGTALLPDLAYVILFLPMIVVIAFRPTGLFGRRSV